MIVYEIGGYCGCMICVYLCDMCVMVCEVGGREVDFVKFLVVVVVVV